MTGVLSLIGGREHTPGLEAADRVLLRSCGVRRPEVAVLLAASPDRRRAFKQAEAEVWWAALGARARCAFAGEEEPEDRAVALVAEADVIVLTGGRPWLLRRRLQHTPLGRLVWRRWREGVPVAGSSAGAMVLADYAWSLRPPAPLAPCPGLGLAAGTLVAPHAGRHGINTWAWLTQAAHPALEVLGIPDSTALILRPDGDRAVVGAGSVVLYRRRPRLAGGSVVGGAATGALPGCHAVPVPTFIRADGTAPPFIAMATSNASASNTSAVPSPTRPSSRSKSSARARAVSRSIIAGAMSPATTGPAKS